MRSEVEIESHISSLMRRPCRLCSNARSISGPDGIVSCSCVAKMEVDRRAYVACIPAEFIDMKWDDITFAIGPRNGPIAAYLGVDEKGRPKPETPGINHALRTGSSLYLFGANGAGKTTLGCYVLMDIMRRRRYTCYYTTMMHIAIARSGPFAARVHEGELIALLYNVDFLFIDEMGKERTNAIDTSNRVLVEGVLKERYQNRRPTIVASNVDFSQISQPVENGGYGASIASMMGGARYQHVTFDPQDIREEVP
jgi:hypothetical protein